MTDHITNCRRCGRPARGRVGNPDARPIRRALEGECAECSIVLFLQKLSNMSGGGLLPPGATWTEALRLPHVQEQFGAVLRVGLSDLTLEEIDWERVIELWVLKPHDTGILF